MLTVEELKIMFESDFGHEINVSELNEDSDLRKDLGMNSISLLYMAMMLEEKFSIQFENSDLEKITTVKEVINIIESKVQSK